MKKLHQNIKYISIFLLTALVLSSVTGFIADLFGYSNEKINQIIERKGFSNKTGQKYLLKLYFISIAEVYGEIPSGDALKLEYGGEWNTKILLVAGVPILLYDSHAFGWE